MATLVTLQQAKDHLAETATDRDGLIELKVEQATAIVLDICNTTSYWRDVTTTWTDETVPGAVQTAILLVLTYLVEQRGDDPTKDAAFWDSINRLLARHRDPVIA